LLLTGFVLKIAELRSHLNTSPPTSEGFSQFAPSNKYGPVLLFGQQLHATREEILEDLPSRDEMDRLIVSYFGSMDMAPGKDAERIIVLHS